MARERLRLYGSQSGSRIRKYTGETEIREVGGGSSYCLDFVGRQADHPLFIERTSVNFPTITGDTGDILSGYVWNNYPVQNLGANMSSVLGPTTPEPDDVWAATSVAAATNPGRPDVSVPLLIFDTLGSLPKTIWDFGNAMISSGGRPGGNSVASGNFGWGQLYSDVAALFDFTEHVEKRTKELQALYTKGGLKRRRTVWSDTSTEFFGYQTLQSQGVWIEATVRKVATRKKWVAVRWRPANPVQPLLADQVQHARTLVHGWHIAPADVWNALPWSWLVDYFANTGDFLGATRNSSEFILESSCVCLHFRMDMHYGHMIKPEGLTVTQPSSFWETKSRKLEGPGLTTNVPIISAQRLTNLLGIAANYKR